MNTLPPLNRDQEIEWAKQERAFDAERRADGSADVPPSYRLLARALREPLPSAPPSGFAAAVARCAEREILLDAYWERRGVAVLLALLAVLGVGVLFAEGQYWLADLQAALPSLPRLVNGWSLLLLAGIALAQWPPGRWLR